MSTGKQLLTEIEASEYLSIPVPTLRKWRSVGGPIPFLKVGGKLVRYDRTRLAEVLAGMERRSTSDTGSVEVG
jgi:excisionase family DNA binding protein